VARQRARGRFVERGSLLSAAAVLASMKQVIAARTDLDMGRGKLAAQVAHASLSAYEDADRRARTEWKGGGQKKIVVKVSGERELFEVADRAEREGLPHAVVRDAGHTQLEPGTATTCAVGPGRDDVVDEVTGDYPLY